MHLNNKKKILIGLLWLAGLIDAGTFLFGRIYQFEINPIYLIFKSVFLLLIVKVGVLTGVSYLLLTYKPKPEKTYTWAYALTFMVVFAIIAQLFGGYLNVTTKHQYETSEPGTVVPMDQEEAMQTYTKFQFLLLYLPLFLAVLSFWVFERLYYEV